MSGAFIHLAFIGPGGPEFLLILLVLVMMFGAKDAPRILRKLNEIINQIRNTADGFKREVMYSDLEDEVPDYEEEVSYMDEDYHTDLHVEGEPESADTPEETEEKDIPEEGSDAEKA